MIRKMKHETQGIQCISFSPDGTLLVSGYWENMIDLWNVADGSLLKTLIGHRERVESVRFSPNGNLLVSGSIDGTIKIWGIPPL
jgi:WD40 repeat protein